MLYNYNGCKLGAGLVSILSALFMPWSDTAGGSARPDDNGMGVGIGR